MTDYISVIFSILATSFLIVLGLLVLIAIFLTIRDVAQTKDAIRKNYPLIGRFRDLFSTLGAVSYTHLTLPTKLEV